MKTPEQRKHERQQRKNAAGHAAAGAGLVGTAAAANYLNDAALERKDLDKPVKSAVKRKGLKPAHARYAAAKVGIRGLQVTGIPLAAYGAYNMVKPGKRVPKVDPVKDVARPVARGTAFKDAAELHRMNVEKSDRRRQAGGVGLMAAGAGAGAVALSANRGVDAAERAVNARIDRWAQGRKSRLPGYGVSASGRPVPKAPSGASRAQKDRARQAAKRRQGAVNEINRKANVARRVSRRAAGLPTRAGLIGAGFSAAVPLTWLGARRVVDKAADKHDVDAFMGASMATGAAYHGGLYSTKRVDRRIERNVANTKEYAATLRRHRKDSGLPKNASMGDARWIKYNRTYPKSIPGWRWKRAMSRLQGGKSQVAISGALMAGAGAAGVAANRKIHPKSERVGKQQVLTREDQDRLKRRKSLGRNLSLASGTMGLGALALRSPEMARAVASRSKKLAASPRVQRLMAKEPAATKASNTLGIAAIGTGSVGSFNYASQQKLERRQFEKAAPQQFGPGQARRAAFKRTERLRAYLRDKRRASWEREMGLPKVVTPETLTAYLQAPTARTKRTTQMLQPKPKDLSPRVEKTLFRSAYIKGVGRVRVTGSPKKDYFDVVDSRDQRRLVHRSRVTPVKDKKLKAPVQPQLPFGKRDDKFLREYRDRISPKAEQGYNNMRRQRNKDRAWAVTQTGLTGLNAAGLAAAVKGRSKVWTPVAAGATAFSASQAVKHGRKAQGYDKGPMEGIRRKARDRANRGVYGADRGKDPVDKALRPMTPPIPRSVPKGMLRRPTQRRAHVSRRPTGRLVSVKSSFG